MPGDAIVGGVFDFGGLKLFLYDYLTIDYSRSRAAPIAVNSFRMLAPSLRIAVSCASASPKRCMSLS